MVLPPRPLRLKPSFVWLNQLGGVALLLIGLAAGGGYAWWQAGTIRALLAETKIWRDGVPALRAEVSGQVRTNRFIFHTYELEVRYVDANGEAREQPLEFDTLWSKVDQDAEVSVRHLPDAPEQFALSWAMAAKSSRWASIVFMALAGVGLIGGSFFLLGWLAVRRLRDARRCAQRSDEIAVQITQVTQQVVQGRHNANVYHYTGQMVDGRTVAGKMSLAVKHEPLFGDPARRTMMALVAPDNLKRPLIVRGDFHPFRFTADEEAAVHAAIARNILPAPNSGA